MEPIIANLKKCIADLETIIINQQMPKSSNDSDLTTLYNKLEEKCEKVELQSIEIAKWKSHAMKLDESRLHGLKLLETANGKIVELEKKLVYLESKLKSKSVKYSKLKNHLKKLNKSNQ